MPKAKQKLINTVLCRLHRRKDVMKNGKNKIGDSFLEKICFILSFKNNISPRLCAITVCSLLFIYALLEAVVEKCLLNSCLVKLRKIL